MRTAEKYIEIILIPLIIAWDTFLFQKGEVALGWFSVVSLSAIYVLALLYRGERRKVEKLAAAPQIVPAQETELPGRYMLGIDIGRNKIDYCLLDYDEFKRGALEPKMVAGTRPTPHCFRDIYGELADIIHVVAGRAMAGDTPSIDGIGLGLPGQVNPKTGCLLKSPGFDSVYNEPLVQVLTSQLKQSGIMWHPGLLDSQINVDNDARCATRYVWQHYAYNDLICIFAGIGVGSGIVLHGKMLYGSNFTAGEIGHTTIFENSGFLPEQRCACDLDGCHWETLVSREGMLRIARSKNPPEYNRLKVNYSAIIKAPVYKKLLANEAFGKHKSQHHDDRGELTTYFFSLAFNAGDRYAAEVVKEYVHYLAIGIANYINVINPTTVYLGGGMIRGFYDDKFENPHLYHTVQSLLRTEILKYALPSSGEPSIITRDYKQTQIASMGAALINKDKSYFDFKGRL